MTARTSCSSNTGPMPSHRAMCLSLSQTSPMFSAPRTYSGCDCSRSQVALADKRCELSLCGDVRLDTEDSVDSKPLANRALSNNGSSSDETLFVEREDDSMLGSSTKLGGWCLGGDDEAVALRISFSVCVRCKRSLSRSLSDCNDEVVVVRRLSLVSRSRTCRSFRSRNALCLQKYMLARIKKCNYVRLTLLCSVLSSLTVLESTALCPRYLTSCLGRQVPRCPNPEQVRCQKSHWGIVMGVVRSEKLSWSYALIQVRCHLSQPMHRNCTRKQMARIHWRQTMFPCSTLCQGSAPVLVSTLAFSLEDRQAYLHSTITISGPMAEYTCIVAKAQVAKGVRCGREVIVIVHGLHCVRYRCLGSRLPKLM